ncbi:hypothetical protein Tco_1327048 [Tanacetum coccineum]
MDSNLNNENDEWKLSLDIDDFDLRLTPVFSNYGSKHVETSIQTQHTIRIIPGPAGIVQSTMQLKQMDTLIGRDEDRMSAQEYMKELVDVVGEDEDFKVRSGLARLIM